MKDNALYLEVDEDITSAIDKLSKSEAGSVQIVVPKRSTMLQSIINLKLLKKAADGANKELVLVTGDRIATDLAARVGLAVAPSLGAKAVVGEAVKPEALSNHEEIIEADEPEPDNPVPAPAVPKAPAPSRKPLLKRTAVSDGPPAPPSLPVAPAAAIASSGAEAASKTSRGPKVPNFGRLQRRVIWLGLAVVLIVGYLGAMYLFTNAKVTLYAAGNKVSIDETFSVDPTSKTTDASKSVLAGQTVTLSKDLNGSFAATGKKDVGTKAGGTMTVKNEYDMSSHQLQAGTRFQAPDGKIFRSDADATVPGATPTLVNGRLGLAPGTTTVHVTADASGDGYNEAAARYTIPGLSAAQQSQIYGQGDQMTGGTSKTINVVSQSDVDTQKATLIDKDKDNAARDLKGKASSGYTILTASQSSAASSVSSSPAVDSEGDNATLTVKVTYTALAVKESDYKAFIEALEQKQVGASSQIYDNGIDGAQITASDKDSTGRQTFHLTTEAYSGAKLDQTAIAGKLKGARYGDAVNTASGLPGVSRAEVSISPAWVSSLPSRPSKIHVVIQVAQAK